MQKIFFNWNFFLEGYQQPRESGALCDRLYGLCLAKTISVCGTCHPAQQCGSLMCFNSFLDNNGALWHRGRRYIRLWYTHNTCIFIVGLALHMGFDDKENIEYLHTYPFLPFLSVLEDGENISFSKEENDRNRTTGFVCLGLKRKHNLSQDDVCVCVCVCETYCVPW